MVALRQLHVEYILKHVICTHNCTIATLNLVVHFHGVAMQPLVLNISHYCTNTPPGVFHTVPKLPWKVRAL